MLDELVSRVETAVKTFTEDFEIILVNDCSPDDSWTKMKEICATDKKVKGINLSRNFGQHYAITAGLTASTGEWVVVMDCDLQDRPEEIPNLYQKAQEGYDTVFAEIIERDDRFMKKFTSRAFSYVFAYFTDSPVDKKTNNFGIYHRKVIDAVLSMGDYIKCFPVEVRWVGFKIGYHPVIKDARAEGTSGYTWAKLISFAFDKKTLEEVYEVKRPTILEVYNSFLMNYYRQYMKALGNEEKRYSDLPDEVQIKDKISLDYLSFITYPCEEFFDSRLFFRYTTKRKKLIEEINNLRSVLISHGKDLDIYDINTGILLDEEGIEKVIRLTK